MDDDKILISNIIEKAKTTYMKDIITNTNFLDIRQLKLAEYNLNKNKYRYEIIKINEEMEKVIILFLPTYFCLEDININDYMSCIKISIKKGQKLTHRDYMGAIYNLGIKRDFIGDILLYDDNSACVFCIPKIAEYLKYNLYKIGKYEVNVDILKLEEIEIPKHMYREIEINVKSNRLDSVTSEVTKISRNKMIEKILSKQVFVNCEQTCDKSYLLKEGDIFSIKGVGKFKVGKNIGISKKGNLIYIIKEYI